MPDKSHNETVILSAVRTPSAAFRAAWPVLPLLHWEWSSSGKPSNGLESPNLYNPSISPLHEMERGRG